MSEANGRNLDALVRLPPVLDACCGPKGMWFDKHDPRAIFLDRVLEAERWGCASATKEPIA